MGQFMLLCRRCKHEWTPEVGVPELCPKCRQPKWWVDRELRDSPYEVLRQKRADAARTVRCPRFQRF